jgi:PAS domain S-box-containing protein
VISIHMIINNAGINKGISLENKFAEVFQISPDAIAITNLKNGKYLDVNEGYLKLFGYSSEELVRNTATDLHIWTDPEKLKLFKQRLLELGEVKNMEVLLLTKAGQTITCLLSARTIELNGEVFNLSITRDISERKAMENALHKSEEWSRFILDHTNDGIHIDNTNDQIIQVNPRFCEMMGYSQAELLKMHVSDLIAPEVRKYSDHVLAHEISLFGNQPFEALNIHSSGRRIPVEVSVSKVISPQGEVFISLVRDISERKQTDAAIHEQAKLIRTVFETVPVGIFIVNKENQITLLNPAGQKIWEGVKYVGVEEMDVYKGWWRSTGKRLTSHEWGSARAVENGETVINEEIEIECFNGVHKIISNSALPLYNDENQINGAIVVLQDITEQTESAEELRRRNDYLAAMQETTIELVSLLDLDLLLDNITKRAGQFMQTPFCYLNLLDPESGQMVPKVGKGATDDSMLYPVQLGEGVAGIVWQTGKPLVINDYDHWSGRVRGYKENVVFSVAGVPLISENVVVGVLELAYAFSSKKIFEPEYVEFLSQFARLATIALKNARLYTIAQKEIADRILVDGALRESEHRFHQMFAEHNATMLLLDPVTGKIIDANPAASEFYGYSMQELRSMNIRDINLLKKEKIEDAMKSTLEQNTDILIFPHRLANGEVRTVEVHSSPIEVNNKKILFSIIHDITDRQQAETQVQQQLDELRRWHSVTLGREARVMELKYEVNELLRSAGLPLRYEFTQEPNNE